MVRLFEPAVAPLLRANIWVVRGRDYTAVIDAGMGLVPLRSVLPVDADTPLKLILTHGHRDHVGAAHEFECVCAHSAEAEAIEHAPDNLPIDVNAWPEGLVDELEAQGYRCRCGMLTELPFAGFAEADSALQPTRVTDVVDEGATFDLGGSVLEVVHLPGHSPGSIGLYDRAAERLFSGDAIYDGPLLADIHGASKADYIASFERLMRMNIRIVHPGHEASFSGERMREIARVHIEKWRAAA